MAKKKNTLRADGRIAVQVYLGSVDGRRKYKTVYGQSQREAEEKATQVKLSLKRGMDIGAQHDTFGDWAKRWLEIKRYDIGASQYKAYTYYLKHLEVLYHLPLSKITASDIQAIITGLAVKNPNTGKPTSKETLKKIHSTVKQIFISAIQNRAIDFNPVDAVTIPQKAPQTHRRALTQGEQRWILDTPHRAQTAAMVMMFAGLRRGELIPLTWNDVDLEQKTISVHKSVEFIDGHPVLKEGGKTSASTRVVTIPSILVDYLKQLEHTGLYLVTSAKGRLMTLTAWRCMWNSYLHDLNFKYGDFSDYLKRPKSKFEPSGVPFVIPKFTPHWFRHTYATMLYLAGVDILTAKAQLGHSDVKTTLGIYTHLNDQFKINELTKLDDFVDLHYECKSNASQKIFKSL